jgi:hypothetical protein
VDDNLTLAYCILINQRERNTSIGIANDTQLVNGMAKYIRNQIENEADEEINRIAKTAWLKSSIEEYSRLAKRLTDYILANIEDDDIRNEGVYTIKKAESYIHFLEKELDNLWQN